MFPQEIPPHPHPPNLFIHTCYYCIPSFILPILMWNSSHPLWVTHIQGTSPGDPDLAIKFIFQDLLGYTAPSHSVGLAHSSGLVQKEVLPLDPPPLPPPPTLKNGLPYKNRPNLMNSSSLFIIGYSNCTNMVDGCTQSFFVHQIPIPLFIAGQSSLVARKAHNLEVSGSNLVSTKFFVKKWRVKTLTHLQTLFLIPHVKMKPNQDLDSLTSSLSLYKLPLDYTHCLSSLKTMVCTSNSVII